jgi:hypothetical protein
MTTPTSASAPKKFRGVYVKGSTIYAEIRFRGEKIYLGSFDNRLDAAIAYNQAAAKYHGKRAVFNEFPTFERENPSPPLFRVPVEQVGNLVTRTIVPNDPVVDDLRRSIATPSSALAAYLATPRLWTRVRTWFGKLLHAILLYP